MDLPPPQLVRRHWSFVLAYCGVTSLAVGFVLPAVLFSCLVLSGRFRFESGDGGIIVILLVLMGVISFAAFIGGPMTFTRDVVCRTCHRRRKLERIPFLAGDRGGYRIPEAGQTVERTGIHDRLGFFYGLTRYLGVTKPNEMTIILHWTARSAQRESNLSGASDAG